MARPPTWLPRPHEIRRTVANSARSLYERKELERLFELQPRAAQNPLALLPSVPIGKAYVVEREALVSLLDLVHEVEDPIALCDRLRRERAAPTHGKPCFQIPSELEPGDYDSLPATLGYASCQHELQPCNPCVLAVDCGSALPHEVKQITPSSGLRHTENYWKNTPESGPQQQRIKGSRAIQHL